jgi:hypothetical protein
MPASRAAKRTLSPAFARTGLPSIVRFMVFLPIRRLFFHRSGFSRRQLAYRRYLLYGVVLWRAGFDTGSTLDTLFLVDDLDSLFTAENSVHRAGPHAGVAGAFAFIGTNIECGELRAYLRWTAFFKDVGVVFIFEIFYCGQDGIRGGLPQAAE